MNRQYSDTIRLCALNGLCSNRFVPFLDESVDLCSVVLTEQHQLVEESTNVSTLLR